MEKELEYKIDVENILEEIRQEIKDRSLTEEIMSFDVFQLEYDMNQQKNVINAVLSNLNKMKKSEIELCDDFSGYRKVTSKLVGLIKRVVFKLTFFIFKPLVDDINNYNRGLVGIQEKVMTKIQQLDDLSNSVVMLKQDLNRQLESNQNGYQKNLDEMIEENKSLKMKQEVLELKLEKLLLEVESLKRIVSKG